MSPGPAAGCWLLAAGCWLLAAGCWRLAAGCWLLAAGCWLLAAAYSRLLRRGCTRAFLAFALAFAFGGCALEAETRADQSVYAAIIRSTSGSSCAEIPYGHRSMRLMGSPGCDWFGLYTFSDSLEPVRRRIPLDLLDEPGLVAVGVVEYLALVFSVQSHELFVIFSDEPPCRLWWRR